MGLHSRKWLFKVALVLLFFIIVFLIISNMISVNSHYSPPFQVARMAAERKEKQAFKKIGTTQVITDLKDWHDYAAMQRDARRVGPGEQGKAAILKDFSQRMHAQKVSLENGFNALLSDIISLNRSVPDIRNVGCRTKKYPAKLPDISIIIPCYNEYFSALARTLYSIVNRTPPELLKEIILVDDGSTRENLKEQLDTLVAKSFPKVQILRLKKRKGLINARLAGALQSTGDVLVFLDSHIETNYNWLPPLLEPIAYDKRTVVCPFIDVIDDKNFEYTAQDEGERGAFDWNLDYKRLPRLPDDMQDPTKPFANPVMSGGLFAISKEFFWELGGYDDGLEVWGGEQYELSFKIWMCGGKMLDAPCSRVGHIYRGPWEAEAEPRTDDYVHKNYKRVVEVWMDEYKQYVYARGGGVYERIDAGDLTQQKALRNKLHCRSFKWYIENIAFDLVKHYPPMGETDYAYGAIQSMLAPELCLDSLGPPQYERVGLRPCNKNLKLPRREQNWALSKDHDLRLRGENYCLDVPKLKRNAPIMLLDCHRQGGRQFWQHDLASKEIRMGTGGRMCMLAIPKSQSVVVRRCQENVMAMKWKFANVNMTAFLGGEEEQEEEQEEEEEEIENKKQLRKRKKFRRHEGKRIKRRRHHEKGRQQAKRRLKQEEKEEENYVKTENMQEKGKGEEEEEGEEKLVAKQKEHRRAEDEEDEEELKQENVQKKEREVATSKKQEEEKGNGNNIKRENIKAEEIVEAEQVKPDKDNKEEVDVKAAQKEREVEEEREADAKADDVDKEAEVLNNNVGKE